MFLFFFSFVIYLFEYETFIVSIEMWRPSINDVIGLVVKTDQSSETICLEAGVKGSRNMM